jgi:hypothetical protein
LEHQLSACGGPVWGGAHDVVYAFSFRVEVFTEVTVAVLGLTGGED